MLLTMTPARASPADIEFVHAFVLGAKARRDADGWHCQRIKIESGRVDRLVEGGLAELVKDGSDIRTLTVTAGGLAVLKDEGERPQAEIFA